MTLALTCNLGSFIIFSFSFLTNSQYPGMTYLPGNSLQGQSEDEFRLTL